MRGMVDVVLIFLLLSATSHASISVIRTSNDGPQPSYIEIEVQLPNPRKVIRIQLTKTNSLDNVPVTVSENGVSTMFSAQQAHCLDHTHYRDIQTKSVISVKLENGKERISGHVVHEGISYFIEPSSNGRHIVRRNFANQMNPIKPVLKTHRRTKRQSNQAATKYEVELLILCDHTVWSVFKSIYGSDDKALTELHFYYTHILNGIDVAFRNIGNPSVSVKCTGLTVAKTQADAKWLPPAGSSDFNNATSILGYLQDYAKGKNADHLMAFTRTDIQKDEYFSAIGATYIGGICQNTRVSIVEDIGLHSWGCASHQLAQNLGATDHEDCQGDSLSIMSPAVVDKLFPAATYDVNSIAKSYRFSTCTVQSIDKYLRSWHAECLKSRQGVPVKNLTGTAREGARMSLDQVCRLAFPSSPGRFVLTADVQSTPALLCTRIYCALRIGDTSGVTDNNLRAPVGSPCGNKKSCDWNGQCVPDASAPAADENCFFGDQWGQICAGWKAYIKHLRDLKNDWTADSNCRILKSCCYSLKNLCKFNS